MIHHRDLQRQFIQGDETHTLTDKLIGPDLKSYWKSGERSPRVVLEGWREEAELDLALAINVNVSGFTVTLVC